MFTGLVRSVGSVERVRASAELKTFVITAALGEAERALGASVSVSGVCLPVTAATPHSFPVEAAFETLAITSLGGLAVGSRVNLEPALRLGDALNLEVDLLARYVARLLDFKTPTSAGTSAVTHETLTRAGFIPSGAAGVDPSEGTGA